MSENILKITYVSIEQPGEPWAVKYVHTRAPKAKEVWTKWLVFVQAQTQIENHTTAPEGFPFWQVVLFLRRRNVFWCI